MVRLTRCRRRTLLLLAALALALLPAGALANAGPPRRAGDTGGPLLPGTSDQVHVLGEELRFDLGPDLGSATVTARYRLANRGPDLEDQRFVFVVQDVGGRTDLAVSWNGEPVPVRLGMDQLGPEELAEMARAWTSVDQWLDPVTGEPYEAEFYGSDPVLRYYLFSLDMPAGAEGELAVTYDHTAGSDRTRYTYRVHHYSYLLLPARGWASFGPLQIRVAAPAGSRYYFAANLDFRDEGGEYVAEYPGLPEANLTFAVMNRAGLFLGPQPGPYYGLGFALVLVLSAAVGVGIGRLAGRLPRPALATGVGVLAALVPTGPALVWLSVLLLSSGLPQLRDQAYASALAGFATGLVGAALCAAVAGWTARGTWRRRRPAGGPG